MNKLLLILLLFPLSLFSQIQEDKIMHFGCSASLVYLGMETAKDYNFKNPDGVVIISALTMGFAKEYCLDKRADANDLLADFTGVITGYAINKLVHKLEKKRKQKIKRNDIRNY
jgi:uncharacterized protein YfiM (DUF2279 family)